MGVYWIINQWSVKACSQFSLSISLCFYLSIYLRGRRESVLKLIKFSRGFLLVLTIFMWLQNIPRVISHGFFNLPWISHGFSANFTRLSLTCILYQFHAAFFKKKKKNRGEAMRNFLFLFFNFQISRKKSQNKILKNYFFKTFLKKSARKFVWNPLKKSRKICGKSSVKKTMGNFRVKQFPIPKFLTIFYSREKPCKNRFHPTFFLFHEDFGHVKLNIFLQ